MIAIYIIPVKDLWLRDYTYLLHFVHKIALTYWWNALTSSGKENAGGMYDISRDFTSLTLEVIGSIPGTEFT